MRQESILVIDDNTVNLKITAAMLVASGHRVATAASAEEALAGLDRTAPRLILTDIQLSGMDGCEFTRRLKSRPEWRSIPVLAVTAAATPEDEAMIRAAGCDGYVPKPLDRERLETAVRRHLVPARAPIPGQQNFAELSSQFAESGAAECRAILSRLPTPESKRIVAPLFDYEELRRSLHQWAGIGGTLGLPQVTVLARKAEALLARPYGEIATALRAVLNEILEALSAPKSAARPEPAGLPSQSLSGIRFGLLNWPPEESPGLVSALERLGASHRQVTVWEAVDTGASIRRFDVLICRPPADRGVFRALIRSIEEAERPCILLTTSNGECGALPATPHVLFQTPPEAEELLAAAQNLLDMTSAGAALRNALGDRKPVILLGDDDPFFRAFVKETLESQGFLCRVAENGRMALATARNDPPDALLLDVNMPCMDGFEVLNALRYLQCTRNMRIVLLTGRQAEADIMRGLMLGADAYVVKPVQGPDLVSRLTRILWSSRPGVKRRGAG